MVQIGEALLLSLVTIAAAWSGYAAAKWSTESRLELAQGATARNLVTRADLSALSTRNLDASTFNAWFTAFTLNDPQKQAIAERRIRPEFRSRLRRLDGHRSGPQPARPTGTYLRIQYRRADQAKAEALDRKAVAASAVGHHAGGGGRPLPPDHRLLLAAVLFLVGIGSTFELHTIRYTLITIRSLLLILAP